MTENKHSAYDLAQMQALSLSAKIRMTERRISQWYDEFDGNVYVSVSGGKDSQVLAHIVKRLYPDVPCVYVKTGLEYSSVDCKAVELSNEIIRPEKSFLQIITEYGYPIASKEVAQAIYECQKAKRLGKEMPKYRTDKLLGKCVLSDGRKSPYNMEKWGFLLEAPFRISHLCCNYSKKKPSISYEKQTDRKAFLGTMADESRLRKSKWLKYGCNAFEEKRPTSQPLSFWTEQDILQYVVENNLQIADAYGKVILDEEDHYHTTKANRTGCVYCLFGITQDTDRLLRLKELEYDKYDYLMRGGKYDNAGMWIPDKGLGYKFIIDWLNEHGNLGIKY